LPKKYCTIPDFLKKTKNIFIYFDYEREFGGHSTNILDENIKYLIDILERNSIKSTWFTIGKVFEKYSKSIDLIEKSGHELGSHTYAHLAPFYSSFYEIKNDFNLFNKIVHEGNHKINGFHSPQGRWAFKNYKMLKKYNYSYELVGNNNKSPFVPYYLVYLPAKKFFRLLTTGDDWPVFRDKIGDKKKIFEYFVGLSDRVRKGEIGGIGFHPWILFSDPNILSAFEDFLTYIKNQTDLKIESAFYFYNQLKKD